VLCRWCLRPVQSSYYNIASGSAVKPNLCSAAGSRIPILAMTANVMEAEVQQCIDAGMDGFIPKPFKQEELVAAIEVAIRRSEN